MARLLAGQARPHRWLAMLIATCLVAPAAVSLDLVSTPSAGALDSPPVFVSAWGSVGSGNGQFRGPTAVAVDSSGDVIVVERTNNRVQKFDSSGNFVQAWGASGTGNGQFDWPSGVAVDASDAVYVVEARNNRVQKFDSSGNFLLTWGSPGTANGQFNQPNGVAVDTAGNVFVADTSNRRVQKFDSSGTFLLAWGSFGTGNGQFNNPWGIAADGAGNVYVSENAGHRVQKFDGLGQYLGQWGSLGTAPGQFSSPTGLDVDSLGNVYVVEDVNRRVQKFDGSGNFMVAWGSQGSGNGQFTNPTDIAIDPAGNSFVSDFSANRIQKFGQAITAYNLTVTATGAGSGSVSSLPAGLSCGAVCSADFDAGTVVTLAAAAASGSTFAGWSGAGCAGTAECVVTMDDSKSVSAAFDQLPVLSIANTSVVEGSTGQLLFGLSSPTVVATCWSFRVVDDTALRPADYQPDPGRICVPAGVTGPATTGIPVVDDGVAEGPETFTVEIFDIEGAVAGTTNAEWTITDQQFTLTVVGEGSGSGVVTSSPVGVDCGSACSVMVDDGTVVTLGAAADPGSTFAGWSGAGCAGTDECVVTVDAARSVSATFAKVPYVVSVSLAGSGSGSVSSAPTGILCGSSCAAAFDAGTVVTLTATPDVGSIFTGWSDGCIGPGDCVVTMDNAQSVSATFAKVQYDLSVSLAGSGGGSVSSAPTGILCGSSCAASFDAGTVVTLTATPDVGSTFVGWAGSGCSGTGTCQVTMDGANSVSATFAKIQHNLSISKIGNGSGAVTSGPAGIDCGSACNATFDDGTLVMLTATAESGSTFAGWSIASCIGTSTCAVTMSAALSVTATFDRPTSSNATAIAAGGAHTCVIQAGAAKCWGYGYDGQLGDGGRTVRARPVSVVGLDQGVTAIAAGYEHTCAIQNGALKCWGVNYFGQLGDGSTTDRLTPVPVVGLESGVTAIALGYFHTCATQNGAVKCWGNNYSGQLGDGSRTDRRVPVGAVGVGSGVSVVAAGGYQTCAVQNGTAKCWGQTQGAPSGLGSGVTRIAVGIHHACAIQSGAVKCWGENPNGELGDGSTTNRSAPVAVIGIGLGATAVAVSDESSCAVQAGALKCWGSNSSGQLGVGSTTNRSTPGAVSGLGSDVDAVSTGRFHTCAIQLFTAKCWGQNGYGQLGVGNYVGSNLPLVSMDLGFSRSTSGVLAGAGANQLTSGGVAPNHALSTTVGATGAGGAASIIEAPHDPAVSLPGYSFFGYQATITAPVGTVDQPLVLTFRIDASIIPPGLVATDIAVVRNGVPVGRCTHPALVEAVPSPCVASAVGSSTTGMEFTIHTVAASLWQFAVSDSAAPTITFAGPTTFTVDQTVLITCIADDTSGIASTTCPFALNALAYTLPLGINIATATAVDRAGNTATGSVAFTVRVTPTSLCALTKRFVQGSPRYLALTGIQRVVADGLINTACQLLSSITPRLTVKQKSAVISAYKTAVQSLATGGWLTRVEATTLTGLANVL